MQGAFGPSEAWQVVKRLRAEADRVRIAIDLQQGAQRSEAALVVLAHDLPLQERHGRRVVLKGLLDAECEVLRYLCAEGLVERSGL